jgi:hypothetical protein
MQKKATQIFDLRNKRKKEKQFLMGKHINISHNLKPKLNIEIINI